MADIGAPTSQLNLHAKSGAFLPQTLKFTGSIGRMEVYVLVDGGGTHNFVQSNIISMLNLPITSNKQFKVMVGMAIAEIYNYMWLIWFWVVHVSLLKPYRGGKFGEVRISSLIMHQGTVLFCHSTLPFWAQQGFLSISWFSWCSRVALEKTVQDISSTGPVLPLQSSVNVLTLTYHILVFVLFMLRLHMLL